MPTQITRTPEMFNTAWMLGEDFDGTTARTFEPSPHNLGIHEAYEIAIEGLFGLNGVEAYRKDGGLRNRAPLEVVQGLAPDATEHEARELHNKIVSAKLDVLFGEIGPIWPQPVEGYISVRRQIEAAKTRGRIVDEVIISSGHEPFIRRVYDAWGEPAPDIIVATEVLEKTIEFTPDELIKPSAGLMLVARTMWRTMYGVDFTSSVELQRALYAGDDPIKDGGLAKNSGVPFIHITSESPAGSWQKVAHRLNLGDLGIVGATA